MKNGDKGRKFHIIYKTTNKITNRFYIGMHSTYNLEDGYLGSGKMLHYSITKYGKENHEREILEYLPTRKELIKREEEIVNEDLINEALCMNLMEGGRGGYISDEHYEKIAIAARAHQKEKWQDPEYRELMKSYNSEKMKQLHKDGKMKYDNFTGKKHSAEALAKMRAKKVGHGEGSSNSQYGSMWITNGKDNKKIKRDEVIPSGWKQGRKMVYNK